MSSIGETLKIDIYGESHGEKIGVRMTGFPSGVEIDLNEVALQMARRRPGDSPLATARREEDIPIIVSGFDGSVTNGDGIVAEIYNSTPRSRDYEQLRYTPRPGHADYAARLKYGDEIDLSGGGKFSGRLTAPLVFAGALCRQYLSGVTIGSHVKSIAAAQDVALVSDKALLQQLNRQSFPVIDERARQSFTQLICDAKAEGDSVGGVVELMALGVPAALGDNLFDGIDGKIAAYLFGIPAVRGVEFGNGFAATLLRGSQNNDVLQYDEHGNVVSGTNNCGGVLGGITNGMPLVVSVAFKPTPSISRQQSTIDLRTRQNTTIQIGGRHDPCIVSRAAVVVESAVAVALADAVLTDKRGANV